jgi:hypothetical protein
MAESKVPFSLKDSITVIATIALVILLYKLLKVVGVIPTSEKQEIKEEKREEKKEAKFDDYQFYTTNNGFSSIYKMYMVEKKKQPASPPLVTLFGADYWGRSKEVAKKIYDSKGVFDDDEEFLFSAFRNMLTVGELISVNQAFQSFKKQNVFDYVREFTNQNERNKIATILDLKPYYIGNKRK